MCISTPDHMKSFIHLLQVYPMKIFMRHKNEEGSYPDTSEWK